MARIRTVKPEFWTDEKVVSLSAFARLLFIGLWNFVDDEGRAAYSPARLKMQILPADPVDIAELLGEIRREKLIVVYASDNKEYFEVCGFTKHQKVDRRNASKLPAPPISPDLRRFPPNYSAGSRKGSRIKEGKSTSSLRSDVQHTPKTTPHAQLETVLDAEHAAAVVDHRQCIRKPLTTHAAKLLAGKFRQCAEPNSAADAMIANGWRSFEPEWLKNRTHARPNGTGPPKPPTGSAKLTALLDTPLEETYARGRSAQPAETPIRAVRDR